MTTNHADDLRCKLNQAIERAVLLRGSYIDDIRHFSRDRTLPFKAVHRRESRLARLQRGKLLPRIEHKELSIDPVRKVVVMRGEQVPLTVKEFDILYFLAYRAGIVVTKEEVFESVWKEPYHEASTGVVDHISSLRRKLGVHKKNKDYIETVFGIGYRFADTKKENHSCNG